MEDFDLTKMQIWVVLGLKIAIRDVVVISQPMRTHLTLPCTLNGHSTVLLAETSGRIVSILTLHLRK